MGTRALAVLFLAPSLALAQTAALTISDTEINRAECSGTSNLTVRFTPTVTGLFTPNSDEYRLFAQTGTCGSSLPSGTPLATRVATDVAAGQVMTTNADDIRAAIGVVATCDSPDDVTYYLCVYLVNTGGSVVGTASGGDQMFQLAVPPPPVINGVAPANSALEVTVAKGTTTSTEKADTSISFQVQASATGYPTSTAPSSPTLNTTIRVGGLTNGVTYTVVAYAYSSALNPSAVSASASGTPLPFESFWDRYQGDGGQEQGGCGGGAGALSLLALLPLALRRRRP